MSTTITSDDIRYHVQQMTADGRYDVDAIVEHIVRDHGLVDIAALDVADSDIELSDSLWAIVWEHALPDPVEMVGRALIAARDAVRRATIDLRNVVRVDSAEHGTPETVLAERAGVDRMTIRKWLGK